jgi:hypothetical protein
MDYRSFASLALRLAGVFILVCAIAGIPNTSVNLYMFGTRNELTPPLLVTLAPALFSVSGSVIIGLLLIYFPSTVVNRVVARDPAVTEGSIAYRDLQSLAFSVLGLYFICVGLFDLMYWAARGRLYYLAIDEAAAAFPRLPSLAPDEFGGLVSATLQVVGGVALFFGARGLSGLVERLRGNRSADRDSATP